MQLLRAPALVAALLVALGALAVTGIALAFAYDAGADDAHASMQRIEASRAWSLVRAAHAASASVALVAAGLAAARAFLDGARPRAALLGGVALALLLAAFESGMVLPSDQRASEAWSHVRDGAALVGVALAPPHPWLAWVHGAILPLALAAILAAAARRADLRLREALLPLAATLALVVALALLAPPSLGPAPVDGLAVSRPAWPFLWLVPLEAWWGRGALLMLPIALVALTLLAARSARWSVAARRGALVAVVAVLMVLTALALAE